MKKIITCLVFVCLVCSLSVTVVAANSVFEGYINGAKQDIDSYVNKFKKDCATEVPTDTDIAILSDLWVDINGDVYPLGNVADYGQMKGHEHEAFTVIPKDAANKDAIRTSIEDMLLLFTIEEENDSATGTVHLNVFLPNMTDENYYYYKNRLESIYNDYGSSVSSRCAACRDTILWEGGSIEDTFLLSDIADEAHYTMREFHDEKLNILDSKHNQYITAHPGTGSVLSNGSLTIVVGVAAAVIFGLVGFLIGKKRKNPAPVENTNNNA